MNRRVQIHPVAGIATAILFVLFSGARASDPTNPPRPNRILTNDVRINDDAGTTYQTFPAIAMHRHGPAVAVWLDRRDGEGDIYFQHFGRRGAKDGVNIKVNDDLHSGSYANCDAAMDGEGHFVVVFDADGSVDRSHVYAQWYMANARPLGANIQVDDGPDDRSYKDAAVAVCDSGTSVVAWIDGRDDAKGDIWIQRFDRDGTRRGGNVGIAVTPNSSQIYPAVGRDAIGNFVLAWQDGITPSRVMARLFDLGGTAKGPAFQVSPRAGDGIAQTAMPAVAVSSNGGFVVFWWAYDNGLNKLLQARMFDADGGAITDVFRVDEAGKNLYFNAPSVAISPRGLLTAFAWTGWETGGERDIYSRIGDALGGFTFPGAPVNDTPGIQHSPDVAVDQVGNTLFTWADNRNGDYDVYGTWTGPKRPNYVTTGSGYNGMVALSWEPWYGQNVRTQYRITRGESLGSMSLIATVDPSSRPYPDRMLDFIDNTAENGHTYYYGVENVTAGSSGPSYAMAATPSETGYSIRSAWSVIDPSLDGVLSPGEWDGATRVRLENPDALHGVWLYVKNTAGTLYVAVDDSNDMALEPATSFGLFFDLDHDGKWDAASPSSEGAISLTSTASLFQGCWGAYPNGLGLDAAKAAGGIRQSFSATSGHVQYEVAIDLASSPVRAAAGSTIGAGFRVWDPGNFYGYHYANAGEWPEGSLWDAAETLGDLILATEGAVTPGVYTVTNTQDTGPGSLRQAIKDANSGAVPCRVQFQIPVTDPGHDASAGTWTIRPNSWLDELSQRETFLDGTSQAAFIGSDANPLGPEIVLDGGSAGSTSGLGIQASGSEIRHLVVCGFSGTQIDIHNDSSTVAGCFIGTDASGLHSTLTGEGIRIEGNSNTIGGSADTDRNVISGLADAAVYIIGSEDNRVLGNYIGINAVGADTLGNEWGVKIVMQSLRNVIGPGNVISGNRIAGITIQSDADSNSVFGNRIGTDPAGERGLGNVGVGINVNGRSSANVIGGVLEAQRNLISGNGRDGITFNNAGTESNRVIGNYIGTDADGSAAIPNGYGGISIWGDVSGNWIGGENPGEGNLISGNKDYGILINWSGADMNHVVGNLIGTDASGTLPLGNEDDGIRVRKGAQNNQIGPGNLISFNGGAGIAVIDNGTAGNRITQNSIHDNVQAGISLEGGNNNAQAPVLTGALPVAGTASPGAEVELFDGPDDEGMNYLATITADGSGNFTWPGMPTGEFVTATATDADGNTSEFSVALRTGIDENQKLDIPNAFSLLQNHPNPFNPETTIRFDVKEPCRVTLKVLDLRGREVSTLADAKYQPGEHSIRFDASGLASGIYVYTIRMGDFTAVRKMAVMK